MIGSYDTTLTRHFFESLAMAAGICLHLAVLAGRNPHHIVEAQFKAFARALRAAAAPDPRSAASPAPRASSEPAAGDRGDSFLDRGVIMRDEGGWSGSSVS